MAVELGVTLYEEVVRYEFAGRLIVVGHADAGAKLALHWSTRSGVTAVHVGVVAAPTCTTNWSGALDIMTVGADG